MRPYLAILVDSCREAMHSRVLWVVLLCITVMFVGLFPLRLQEHATTGLHHREVMNWPSLAGKLIAASKSKDAKPSPTRHIWDRLKDDERDAVRSLIAQTSGTRDVKSYRDFERTVAKALRNQINDPQWYDPQVFGGMSLRREGRAIVRRIEKGETVSEVERKRLNRLLLEATFPESIDVSASQSYSLAYGYLDSEQPLPLTRQQIANLLPWIVVLLMDWLFGVFGILVALLVTAAIIPQMFEPGSLHLLLSKPISRSLLFLTKFLGGCVFALVSAAYFAAGLWLILGVRFDVWDARLLAAVPVYGFVFAIYYSVTALVGVVFRNTIVSVVLGVVFWLACFGVGTSQSLLQTFVIGQNRIMRLTPTGDSVLAMFPGEPVMGVGMIHAVREFNPEEKKWNTVYRSQQEGSEAFNKSFPEHGPLYDPAHDQLVSIQRSFRGTDNAVSVASHTNLWPRTRAAALPTGAVAMMLDSESRVLVVTLDGIYRSGKNIAAGDEAPKVLGFSLPWGTSTSFEKVSSGDWPYTLQPITTAIDPQSDALALYSRGRVAVWRRDSSGKYAESASRTFDDAEKTEMLPAIAGSRVMLAVGDGRLLALDATKLETVAEFQPEEKNSPRQLKSSPDGKHIAVLFAHGVLWMFDTADDTLEKADIPGQSTISAIAYEPGGKLLFAHHANRVSRFDPATDSSEPVCVPALNTAEWVYYYVVHPVYVVLPKPGELYRTMLYLITGKETEPTEPRRASLSEVEFAERLNPWQPVWSGGLFLLAMLIIGCLYLERMEF